MRREVEQIYCEFKRQESKADKGRKNWLENLLRVKRGLDPILGIHLLIASHLPMTYLDGAAMLLPDGSPVVGLTLRHDRIDNFWFSLLHELVHIKKHLTREKQIIVDDFDLRKHDINGLDQVEKEADQLATSSLIPDKYWKQISSMNTISSDEVKDIAEKIKIHPAIIAGRIRFERNNYHLLTKLVGQRMLRDMFHI